MKTLQSYDRSGVILSIAMGFIIFLCLPVSVVRASPNDIAQMKKSGYQSLTQSQKAEYFADKIQVIEEQVMFFEDELEWLSLKIQTIENSNRHVPSALKKALRLKKEKIAALKKTKDTLSMLLDGLSDEKDSSGKSRNSDSNQTKTFSKKEKEVSKQADSEDCPIGKKELMDDAREQGLDQWIEISEKGTCLTLKTTLPILFPLGSAKVSQEYKSFLEKFSSFLNDYDVRVHVTGGTDPLPIKTKKYPSNFELGAARAANVVHELVRNGLKPSIFRIDSSGEHRYKAEGRSDKNAMERKAQISVIFTG